MDKRTEKALRAFGARVRELRKERGFSQETFAFECEMHRTYIGAIERGEQNVSLVNIIRIANVLGVEPRELLSSTPTKKC